MDPGELKPILAALVLPPAGPLLLALLGLLTASRHRRAGWTIVLAGLAASWLLSTHAIGLMLLEALVPPVAAVAPAQLRDVQAIVVLGGGLQESAPEYGEAQPSPNTLARLRYGAWLARRTGKPLGFAGGVGWAAAGTQTATEGAIARRVLQDEYGLTLRWLDDRSRDTEENAQRMAQLLRPDGVGRIALVSDAWHLPRATLHFRAAGLDVLPAPTGFPASVERPILEWLPSPHGLALSRHALREWLGRLVAGRRSAAQPA
jgi:uncharacterized SAM-binding protein YcdF (DUF218 family)